MATENAGVGMDGIVKNKGRERSATSFVSSFQKAIGLNHWM